MRRILLLLTLLSFFTTPAWCDPGKPFTVGVSLPLTGAFAEYGTAMQNGVSLALKDRPEQFSNIRFLFEDDRYDPKAAVTVFNKFVQVDRINLFFIWGNEAALAIAPICEGRKFPCVLMAQHPKAGAGYRYAIRFINPADDYQRAVVSYLRRQGHKRIGLIKTDVSFWNILVDELAALLRADENLSTFETFMPGETDFRSTILKLKGQRFDILGVYLSPPQFEPFFRAAREQGFFPRIFGSTPLESAAVRRTAGQYLEGAIYSHISASDEFQRRYQEAFGDDLQVSYAANGYEFARLIGSLFNNLAAVPSGEQILSSLAAVRAEESVLGPYSVSRSDTSGTYFKFPLRLKVIKGGRAVTASDE